MSQLKKGDPDLWTLEGMAFHDLTTARIWRYIRDNPGCARREVLAKVSGNKFAPDEGGAGATALTRLLNLGWIRKGSPRQRTKPRTGPQAMQLYIEPKGGRKPLRFNDTRPQDFAAPARRILQLARDIRTLSHKGNREASPHLAAESFRICEEKAIEISTILDSFVTSRRYAKVATYPRKSGSKKE